MEREYQGEANTYEAFLQCGDIAMIDGFQDVDFALQVLEELGRQFLP